MPEFKPRFGLIPAPIENASEAVGGELMVNRNNGHIYVRKDGENVSKTVENEERLNDVDERTKVISQHIVLGNSNWTRLCKTFNKDINIHFNDTIGCMEFSNITTSKPFISIDNYISIDRLREYNLSFSINNITGESNIVFGLDLFDAHFNRVEQAICFNEKSKVTTISKSFGNYLNSNNTISSKACYGKLFIEFYQINTAPASVSINFLEISSIPSYYLNGLNDFKNSYVHINSLSKINTTIQNTLQDAILENDNGVETGKNIKIIDEIYHHFKVRYGRYSVCLRMKVDKIPNASNIGRISIFKIENGNGYRLKEAYMPSKLFTSVNKYKTFYTYFEFDGIDYKNTILAIYINDIADGVKCSLDYITIMPSVVGSFNL